MFGSVKNPIVTLILITNCSFAITGWGQNTNINSPIIYDTVTVYDTVQFYDTVWEYETVYDTLWVVDAIEVDTSQIKFERMEPIQIRQLFYLPFNSHNQNLTYPANKKYGSKKTEPTFANKINSGFQQLMKAPSRTKSFNRQTGKFTLNPNKGKFDPRAFWNGALSIDVYMGYNYQRTKYKFESDPLMIRTIGDSIKAMPGREYGLRLNYNVYQLTIQTGIGISNLKEKFNYTNISFEIDTMVSIPEKDTLIPDYDTTFIYTPKSTFDSYSFIELPLVFSYSLMLGRLQFDLKLGGINQFHYYSKGEIFGDSAIVADINGIIQFTKYNFALYGGAGLQFYLTDHICFGADAYYKYPFKPFCSGLGATFHKQFYGINLAIRYLF